MSACKRHDQNRTLWIGNVEPWMDEGYFQRNFTQNNVYNIKVMRDKDTGLSRNFAFIEFATHEEAQKVVDKNAPSFFALDGSRLKLSWASQNVTSNSASSNIPEESLYVGNLDTNVTEAELLSVFRAKFTSVTCARVIPDPDTGANRPFAFVRFTDPSEAKLALVLLQGAHVGGKPIRIKPATSKNGDVVGANKLGQWNQAHEGQQAESLVAAATANGAMSTSAGFLVHFCGLHPWTTEADVCRLCAGFGVPYRGTVYPGTGTGVIEFMDQESAQKAVQYLQVETCAQAYWVDSNVSGEMPLAHMRWCSPTDQEQQHASPHIPFYAPAVTNIAKPLTQWQPHSEQHPAPVPYTGVAMGAPPAWRPSCPAPSIEHFQQLLQDPSFVQAFETQLAEQACQGPVSPAQTGPGPEAENERVKLPWLLEDRPELFEGVIDVERMNEDFMAVCCRPGLGSPIIPNPARHGLDVAVEL